LLVKSVVKTKKPWRFGKIPHGLLSV